MNGKELQALRKIFMLDASEAAELIGKVSVRSWQYWEAGRTKVPVDVETAMEALKQQRAERIEAIEASIDHMPIDQWANNLELPFYQRFEDFESENPGRSRLDWRVDQSVAAYFFTDNLARLK